jgi:uncharacterized protein
MSLNELLVPTFTQMLRAMAGWLDKAATHQAAAGASTELLLSSRLAPDMYPLAAQIRFACFQAQEPVFRLQGLPFPAPLLAMRQQGSNADKQPGTWTEAQTHLSEALAFLEGLAADALDQHGDRTITLELPNGMIFDMRPDQYARDWSLPQFYFHLNTAYAILRQHGVPLGKADYVPYMLTHLRPGLIPKP